MSSHPHRLFLDHRLQAKYGGAGFRRHRKTCARSLRPDNESESYFHRCHNRKKSLPHHPDSGRRHWDGSLLKSFLLRPASDVHGHRLDSLCRSADPGNRKNNCILRSASSTPLADRVQEAVPYRHTSNVSRFLPHLVPKLVYSVHYSHTRFARSHPPLPSVCRLGHIQRSSFLHPRTVSLTAFHFHPRTDTQSYCQKRLSLP